MKSSVADWLNNQRVREQLKFDIKVCLVKNGYPPQYSPEVFRQVMEQVENFKENDIEPTTEVLANGKNIDKKIRNFSSYHRYRFCKSTFCNSFTLLS